MEKVINIGNKDEALKIISLFGKKNYGKVDIKLENVNLTKLLDDRKCQIFKKKALYVSGETLYYIMQPLGTSGKHNGHNLKPFEVYMALKTLQDSDCVIVTPDNRYIIVSLYIAECGDRIIAIIEKNCVLNNNTKAKINKLVSLYPKNGLENYIKTKKDIDKTRKNS